jgi:hypothetical protein
MGPKLKCELSFRRSPELLSGGLALFYCLFSMRHSRLFAMQGNAYSVFSDDDLKEELMKVDYRQMASVFYAWQATDDDIWHLSESETVLFLKCCKTAQAFLSVKEPDSQELFQEIEKLYSQAIDQCGLYGWRSHLEEYVRSSEVLS